MKKNLYLLLLLVFSFAACEKKPKCIFDESKKNSLVYDTIQAVCYVDLKLADKSPGAKTIRKALEIQVEYLKIRGIITDHIETQEELDSINSIVYDGDLIDYAVEKGTLNLNETQIRALYSAETDYLIFVGLASEIKASDFD